MLINTSPDSATIVLHVADYTYQSMNIAHIFGMWDETGAFRRNIFTGRIGANSTETALEIWIEPGGAIDLCNRHYML